MRDYQETISEVSEGESPGPTVLNDTEHKGNRRLRKSGFWSNGKLRISLLGTAAAVALFVASCGSSNSEEVLTAPQAPPETTAVAPADSVPSVPADEISVAEADIGFDASQTCNQEGDAAGGDAAGPEFAELMANAERLSASFPNLSGSVAEDSVAEGSTSEEVASPAQIAAFTLAGCDVSVDELINMAQDGQIGVETRMLIQAITGTSLAEFPSVYMQSTCLRAGSDNENQVLQAPHRMSRIVAALRDTWLAVQQPDSEEFQQVMAAIGEELAAQIWNAFFDEADGELTLNEQSEAEVAQMQQNIQQTCGYEIFMIDS